MNHPAGNLATQVDVFVGGKAVAAADKL